jgi:tryptophan synthase alpha chain
MAAVSRIPAVFAALEARGRKALIPFITAGDPDKAATVPLMHALAAAGADIVELGVPFSDPMADGPVIQRSSERALKHGTSLRDCLGFAAEFRRSDATTPVVLMGYANPIEAMGYGAFAEAAAAAGVDGVLVVDYPPEESVGLHAALSTRGIDSIFLLSPTSVDARMDGVARYARGYVYYVSLKGVTGAAHIDLTEVSTRVPQIRSRVKLPVGVGFGIRDGATARAVAGVSDAVVIGSRLVQEIESAPRDQVVQRVGALLAEIRGAMDAADTPAQAA